MATACLKSITTQYNTTSGSGLKDVTGSVYIDYSVSDQVDRVVVTSKLVLAITATDGRAVGDVETRLGATNRWTVHTSTYTAPTQETVLFASTTAQTQNITSAQTTTIYKTHAAQTINISSYYNNLVVRAVFNIGASDINLTSAIYTASAKPSYTVSYNLNGGTGSIANQTKWYNETLTLTTAKPTKSGYTFKGWATTLANAQAGNANQGATYGTNAAATFYAVWELNYQKPTIKNISVERCLQSGALNDEGDCALVNFDWTVFRSSAARYYGGNTFPYADNAVAPSTDDGCVITVGSYTKKIDLTGASGHVSEVVGSAFNSDLTYGATISIKDTQTLATDHTTVGTGTLPSQYFPMDFNADATAVGFFMPAPNSNDGAHFGKDVHLYVDTAAGSGTDYTIYQALVKLGWTSLLE